MANHLYDVKVRGASDVKRENKTKNHSKQKKMLKNKILLVSIGVLSLSHASPSPEFLFRKKYKKFF